MYLHFSLAWPMEKILCKSVITLCPEKDAIANYLLLFWIDVDGSTLYNLLTQFFTLGWFSSDKPYQIVRNGDLWVCILQFDVNHCRCFRVAGLSTGISCAGGAAVIANLLPFWTDIDKCNELWVYMNLRNIHYICVFFINTYSTKLSFSDASLHPKVTIFLVALQNVLRSNN